MARGVFGGAATKLIAPVPKPRPLNPPSARVPLVIPRMVAPMVHPAPVPGSIFAEWSGFVIDPLEERERLRIMRRQMCSAEFRCIPEEIARLVGELLPPRPPQRKHHTIQVTNLMKSLSVLPARKYSI
jgi:hypothetical protein